MKQIKNTKNKISKTCKADNTWLYEELGIYNSDPEKDKKINDELKSFLKTIGIKLARINKKNKLPYICMVYYSKCKSDLQKIPLNSSWTSSQTR